ncbi:hypothetical protein H671_4g11331 [Cricetulus griseus]|nr:hypothetical protein H671_4g11331 [Cricetulus griseus]
MKALFFGNIPGVRALIVVFCFILQRPTCLAREQPQACQGEIAYAKEELDSMGCPDGLLPVGQAFLTTCCGSSLQLGPGEEFCPSVCDQGEWVPSQLDILLGHLSQAMLQEGHRLKAWGFLGTGTGAELLQPASACPDDIIVNPVTKLMVPGPNCMMLPVSGHMGPIPPGYFIHPDTGRVLPQTGHLGYDLLKAALIPITDYNAGLMCYPRTELWVPALYGMEIPDPEGSGLMVPILGMHRDGDSGNTTPLAGTMEDAAADKKEWEEEAQVLLGVRKVLHSLGQASEKLRKTSTRLQGQAEEVCLQQSPRNSLQNLLKTQTMQGELVTVQTMHLSAWEFVVYQYGLSVLHLLIPQLQAPETTLQIASHLPAMEVTGNAFEGSFFYQSTENTLFVGRECLASVGRFVLLLIHCLAHITTGDFNQDCNPKFLGSFYEGLKAYFKEAFSTTLQMSAVSWDSKFDQSLSAVLLKEQSTSEKERDLLSKLIERKCEPCLSRQSSEEYIKKSNELLLFTNMEHFLKSILSEEQQILVTPRAGLHGKEKLGITIVSPRYLLVTTCD